MKTQTRTKLLQKLYKNSFVTNQKNLQQTSINSILSQSTVNSVLLYGKDYDMLIVDADLKKEYRIETVLMTMKPTPLSAVLHN